MAASKRISASITVPTGLNEEVLAHELRAALVAAGVDVTRALSVSRTSATVLLAYGDAVVPTGQTDPTTVTKITNVVNAMVLNGVTLVAGTVTSNNVTFVDAPFPDNTFSATKGGSGRPPW